MAQSTFDLNTLREKLTFDEERLSKEGKGILRLKELESQLAILLRIVAVGMLVLLVLNIFSATGNTQDSVLLWISLIIAVISYSLYLKRNRNLYQSNLEHKKLSELNIDGKIQIDDFLSYGALTNITLALEEVAENRLQKLLELLLKSKTTQIIRARLGLADGDIQEILLKYTAQTQYSSQTEFNEMLFKGFVLGYQYDYEFLNDHCLLLTFMLYGLPEIMTSKGINEQAIKAMLDWQRVLRQRKNLLEKLGLETVIRGNATTNISMTSRYAPTIEKYCHDITSENPVSLAKNLSFRNRELEEIIAGLASEEGLVMVVGASGTGKTSLVQSLAISMVAEEVPGELVDKRLLELNISMLLNEAESVGEIAGVLQKLFAEQEKAGNLVLVIEDFDQLLKVRPELQTEILGILTNELVKVKVKVLATVADQNFQKYLSQLPDLTNKFRIIQLQSASPELTLQLMLDKLSQLEAKFKLKFDLAALSKILELSQQIDLQKGYPDKALQYQAQVSEFAKAQGLQFIDVGVVSEFFSQKLGMVGLNSSRELADGNKSSSDQNSNLLQLETVLQQRIVGQQEAVSTVANALRRKQAGFNNPAKPIATFLFCGPTGVGKTYVAESLAELFFGNKDLFLRLDMSEYQEDVNVERLLGSQQEDSLRPGLLTGFVQKHPFSLILLDELEKANPKVLDLFLQILDTASINDITGQRVSFQNTIIIATSNAGSNEIADLTATGNDYKAIHSAATAALKKFFRIEFLNRFDEIITFRPISKLMAVEITKLMLFKEKENLAKRGIEFIFGNNTIAKIVAEGFNQEYGARQLQRTVTQLIEDKVAQAILAGKLKAGDVFSLE